MAKRFIRPDLVKSKKILKFTKMITIENYQKIIGKHIASLGSTEHWRIEISNAFIRTDTDDNDYNFICDKFTDDGMQQYRVVFERGRGWLTAMTMNATKLSNIIALQPIDYASPVEFIGKLAEAVNKIN